MGGVEMGEFLQKYGVLLLEYIWVPIVIPILIVLIRFIICDRFLYIKEIKKQSDNDIEQFVELYNERIDESIKICVEEILQYVGRPAHNSMEHHLYICKKINKTVGFIKFMIAKELKYIFIAYVAIDKTDKTANKYAAKLFSKKLAKKYFKPRIATCIVIEIEQADNGSFKTGLSQRIARYAELVGKKSYYIDMPYIQPQMPDDRSHMTTDTFLSLLYIPFYAKENNYIAKTDLLKIIESIYLDIYAPSCAPSAGRNCDVYNEYLATTLSMYYNDLGDYIKLIPMR